MGDRLYQKKPGGAWYGWFYDARGKRHVVCTKHRDKRAAATALRRFEREAETSAREPKNATPVAPLTDVLGEYIARCERRQRSEGTLHCYRVKSGHLLRVLDPDTDTNTFGLGLEERYVEHRQEEGAHNHTIEKELIVLRAALKHAKHMGWFVGDLDRIRTDHSSGYEPRRRFLPTSEYAKLLVALPAQRRATMAFLVLTAARDAEWQRVERAHVDFDSVLTLPGTKTPRSWRQIPLRDHADLAALLRDVLDSLPDDGQGRLFPSWSNIRRDLHTACDRAGIGHVSPNDLRRTFATWCIRGGMQPSRVALLLGHKDGRMVERIYGVLTAAELGGEVGAIFKRLDLPKVPASPAGVGSKSVANSGARKRHMTRMRDPDPHGSSVNVVPRDRIELPTRGFSIPCSTN